LKATEKKSPLAHHFWRNKHRRACFPPPAPAIPAVQRFGGHHRAVLFVAPATGGGRFRRRPRVWPGAAKVTRTLRPDAGGEHHPHPDAAPRRADARTTGRPRRSVREQLVAEMDGSMIPVVTFDETAADKRKHKTLHWQEGRLALAHAVGSTTLKFGAVFGGGVAAAGEQMLSCARLAGFGAGSRLHGVGDGAVWVAQQTDVRSGSQGRYLLDFWHVCDYLAAAAGVCAPEAPKAWLDGQKERLINNGYRQVIDGLVPYLEADAVKDDKAPVRACHRYLSNRTGQLDYQGALAKGLPIGSGEIESAHRYIIQERLKLPGAWWETSNVGPMLTLRVVRANNQWDDYWQNRAKSLQPKLQVPPHF